MTRRGQHMCLYRRGTEGSPGVEMTWFVFSGLWPRTPELKAVLTASANTSDTRNYRGNRASVVRPEPCAARIDWCLPASILADQRKLSISSGDQGKCVVRPMHCSWHDSFVAYCHIQIYNGNNSYSINIIFLDILRYQDLIGRTELREMGGSPAWQEPKRPTEPSPQSLWTQDLSSRNYLLDKNIIYLKHV
jgi:hypothetical protein